LGGTVLVGRVRDAGHLAALLSDFQTLGLTLVEMHLLPDPVPRRGGPVLPAPHEKSASML
jgi:hypothetical protein